MAGWHAVVGGVSEGRDRSVAEGEKGKTGKEEAREAELRVERQQRGAMEALRERLAVVLHALGAAATANTPFAHDQLPSLVAFVLPLLSSPLVASEAYAATEKLCLCVAPSLAPLGTQLASAICQVVSAPEAVQAQLAVDTLRRRNGGKGPEEGGVGVVERVVGGIARACKKGPLPAASFGFVFPVRVP